MYGNSKLIVSNQAGVHSELARVLERHRHAPWREPLHAPSLAAFDSLLRHLPGKPEQLVLDSGCGTGESTLTLARMFPQALVLGIDQSAVRLAERAEFGFAEHGNAILLRARVETIWRRLAELGWRVHRHFLLYPNPWPKAEHLKRRWHGHPVWPGLLAISDALELRTNWPVYAEEFALACTLSGWRADCRELAPESAGLSPFERKYRDSGHVLTRILATPGATESISAAVPPAP